MSVINRIRSLIGQKESKCTAVILAAGSSQRMGKDKILMDLGGAPVIAYTLMAFQNSEVIDDIVVVTRSESIQRLADICSSYGITKATRVVCGGSTRAESAYIGVCNADKDSTLIAIHDGARPFPSASLIERIVSSARQNGAAAPAVSATDTVRILNKKGQVTATPDRELVVLMQTPQVFDADLIKGALTKVIDKAMPVTDDCSAVEAVGFKVTVVEGERNNIKLTTVHDIYAAEKILADRGMLM
ncbi:MAG: 2-C-methyl-D-erythritol 4-phosphate cytidylyltransferase [Oscillospiraceae bacterium]|nr:2-C-methyl-D-erythritol 4-phosphate cytidylyltransferase [Oscillospiraceae bacterium]